jgi:hypothetical protein
MKLHQTHAASALLITVACCIASIPTAVGIPLAQQSGDARYDQRTSLAPLGTQHVHGIQISHDQLAVGEGTPFRDPRLPQTTHGSAPEGPDTRTGQVGAQQWEVVTGRRQRALQQGACPYGPPNNRCKPLPPFWTHFCQCMPHVLLTSHTPGFTSHMVLMSMPQ